MIGMCSGLGVAEGLSAQCPSLKWMNPGCAISQVGTTSGNNAWGKHRDARIAVHDDGSGRGLVELLLGLGRECARLRWCGLWGLS